MLVAYLGPAGTYSQEAATRAFGEHAPQFCDSLAGVVAAVASGRAEAGVLPIENSTNGPVDLAVDALLAQAPSPAVAVGGEVRVPIRHQLYAKTPDLAKITAVYSHPQVWGQSDGWLRTHLPQAERVSCASTADAVERALAPEAHNVAALGGPTSSRAIPVVDNCADDPNNTTRFLLLFRNEGPAKLGSAIARRSGTERVWLAGSTDLPTLLTALSPCPVLFLAQRPANEPWKYSFLVEVKGVPSGPVPGCTVLSSPVPRARL